jgi:hypothetical protein
MTDKLDEMSAVLDTAIADLQKQVGSASGTLLKLECLKIASGFHYNDADGALIAAKEFHEWVSQ